MFREFSESKEVNEVKGNLWKTVENKDIKISEEILKSLDRKIVVTREIDQIDEDIINQTSEVKDLWRLQFIINYLCLIEIILAQEQ